MGLTKLIFSQPHNCYYVVGLLSLVSLNLSRAYACKFVAEVVYCINGDGVCAVAIIYDCNHATNDRG